jgi:nitrogen fixation/metabolism regulation signal transduction histidine kinase
VIVNLIDNAAEALENSTAEIGAPPVRMLTRSEICVSDTAMAFRRKTKTKPFSFSTPRIAAPPGLAIAARIVAEHGGSIHGGQSSNGSAWWNFPSQN